MRCIDYLNPLVKVTRGYFCLIFNKVFTFFNKTDTQIFCFADRQQTAMQGMLDIHFTSVGEIYHNVMAFDNIEAIHGV